MPTTPANPLQPTPADAEIPWLTRSDLTAIEVGESLEPAFAIRDHVQNEFYRFGELEYFILQCLRVPQTMNRLVNMIAEQFGSRIDAAETAAYIQRLANDNLLVARRLGDGQRLARQHRSWTTSQRWQRWLGLLSIKLPGFYPGPLLQNLRPLGWVLFNPMSIALVFLAAIATTFFAFLSFDEVWSRVPAWSELISFDHLLLMMIGFMLAKILHELGHGLACQQTGHECSEMGVLLLVLMPCMYCDVSDMWTERSRFKRIFVSLAGVFVELLIATVCYWGWYLSVDGPMHRFLFGMMLVTSLNTLFINGNPLMRYDGYYALSDFVRVPNLAAVSRDRLTRCLADFFLQGDTRVGAGRSEVFLIGYAVASVIYRWFVMVAIGWAAWTFLESQQLLSIGRVAITLLLLLSLLPLVMFMKSTSKSVMDRGVRVANGLVFVILLAVAGWFVFNFPFSHRVAGEARIELADARQVFAPESGELQSAIHDGQQVQRGELLATIVQPDLLLERIELNGKLADADARIRSLKFMAESTVVAGELKFWNESRASWQRKLDEIELQLKSLEVRAPVDGRVVVAHRSPIDPRQQIRLAVAEGRWSEPKNEGLHARRGENLCYVADPSAYRGVVEVREQDVELVQVGDEVDVHVPHNSEQITGEVTRISLENDRQLRENGRFEQPDAARTDSATYLVEFQFPESQHVRCGSVRSAVIIGRRTTPWQWLQRWWRHTFWY